MNLPKDNRGLFISIEGMDGSGKSTGAQYFTQCMRDLGLDLISTREIGGTEFGEKIRAMSLTASEPVEPLARLLAFLASRTQHVKTVIMPAITRGQSVICDRYNDSTYVYQGVVDHLLPEYLELMSTCALHFLSMRADVTVFFKVDPMVAFERGSARANLDNDQYKRDKDLAIIIAEAYASIYTGLSAVQRRNIFIVDGNKPLEDVQGQLQKIAARIYEGYAHPY